MSCAGPYPVLRGWICCSAAGPELSKTQGKAGQKGNVDFHCKKLISTILIVPVDLARSFALALSYLHEA